MRTVAVYRIFYGQDFIVPSVQSVLPRVDQVWIFWADRPFAGVREVAYNGSTVEIPWTDHSPFDSWLKRLLDAGLMDDNRVRTKPFWCSDPANQYSVMVNAAYEEMGRPDCVICMEPDHVWRHDELDLALREFLGNHLRCATSRQIELWKDFNWRIPERPNRTGTVFWRLGEPFGDMPMTRRQAEPRGTDFQRLTARVHNLGFCVTPETMYWKHVCALGFSRALGDSIPNESWLKEKWLSWDPVTNNSDLEIARGHESDIPRAVPYDRAEIPEVLR